MLCECLRGNNLIRNNFYRKFRLLYTFLVICRKASCLKIKSWLLNNLEFSFSKDPKIWLRKLLYVTPFFSFLFFVIITQNSLSLSFCWLHNFVVTKEGDYVPFQVWQIACKFMLYKRIDRLRVAPLPSKRNVSLSPLQNILVDTTFYRAKEGSRDQGVSWSRRRTFGRTSINLCSLSCTL